MERPEGHGDGGKQQRSVALASNEFPHPQRRAQVQRKHGAQTTPSDAAPKGPSREGAASHGTAPTARRAPPGMESHQSGWQPPDL